MKKRDTNQRFEEATQDVDAAEKEKLREIWQLAARADKKPVFDIEQVENLWEKLASNAENRSSSEHVGQSYSSDRPPLKRKAVINRVTLWSGITAFLCILIAGSAFLFIPIKQTAPFGQQLTVHTPDGSMIELNGGSSIRHARIFFGERSVQLEGEAYFVIKESTTPFKVHTFNAEVSVLGTTFNVEAWTEGIQPASSITLTSGSVLLSSKDYPEKSIVMEPGQRVSIEQGTDAFSVIESVDLEPVLAWRQGELVYKDQKLVFILEDLERHFGLDVELVANQLADKEVTFAYRQASSAERVLEDLCLALDLQYRPISNGYELFQE